MKKMLCFFLLLTVAKAMEGQNNPASWVFGVETMFQAFDGERNSAIGNFTWGVHVEKPVGRWSVGIGLLKGHFTPYEFDAYTDQLVVNENAKPGEPDSLNVLDHLYLDLKYVAVPVRLIYRLPCNCFYFTAGIQPGFADTQKEGEYSYTRYANTPQQQLASNISEIPAGQISKHPDPFHLAYELGFGASMAFQPQWRFFVRGAYFILKDPFHDRQGLISEDLHQIRLSMGLQWALLKRQ